MTSPVTVITRSWDWSTWLRSGLSLPKMLLSASCGGVGVGVGVGLGVAAWAATGVPAGVTADGAEQAARSGSSISGTRAERFKRSVGYTKPPHAVSRRTGRL